MPFNFRLAAILLACSLLAGCGEVCVFRWACVASDHFSLDPTPLQIDLTTKDAPQASVKLRMPRSFVRFANNYSSRQGPLPQHFASDHIAIRFVGDGEAWSVAFARVGTLDPEKLRAEEYGVALYPVRSPRRRTEREASWAQGGHVRQPAAYDGLVQYSGANEVFLGDASDLFEQISCSRQAHPSWFCTYEIDITDGVFAVASFLDFRMHGGRAYANQRARAVREVVCRFTDCETEQARRNRIAN